jgi:type IV secretion system protein TrbD
MPEVELQRMPIHQSLNKNDLMAGCERQLLLMSGVIAVLLIIVSQTIVAVVFGVIFWILVIGVLRKMAKADPIMSQVYIRHIKYSDFYAAHSTPFAESAKHKRE